MHIDSLSASPAYVVDMPANVLAGHLPFFDSVLITLMVTNKTADEICRNRLFTNESGETEIITTGNDHLQSLYSLHPSEIGTYNSAKCLILSTIYIASYGLQESSGIFAIMMAMLLLDNTWHFADSYLTFNLPSETSYDSIQMLLQFVSVKINKNGSKVSN